jgi:hypothetical protein
LGVPIMMMVSWLLFGRGPCDLRQIIRRRRDDEM